MTFLKKLWGLAGPYWFSSERWKALGLLAGAIASHLGLTLVGVGFNITSGASFNAIQDHDLTAFLHQLANWGGLFAVLLVMVTYGYYFTQLLGLRWRDWMTRRLIDRWTTGQAYYRLHLSASPTDNPDQRITEDVALFVDKTLDLFLGIIHAVMGITAFAAILWRMSDNFDIFGFRFPGLLLWAAVLYSLLGSLLTHSLGGRLTDLNYRQQKREADFRFSLFRVREHAESIALMNGGEGERKRLKDVFSQVIANWLEVIRCKKRVVLVSRAFGQMSGNVAYLLMAPRYFAGGLPLGALVQAQQAFIQIDVSLNWFIQNYQDIALWMAAIERLDGFAASLKQVEKNSEAIERRLLPTDNLSARDVRLGLPDGRVLAEGVDVSFPKGSRTLVTGPSGCGKSTLLNVLAGIWPHGAGQLDLPYNARMMFLPQRPYLPMGSLRAAMTYPEPSQCYEDIWLIETLRRCGLESLIPQLDVNGHWQQRLSPGMQQRLGFARAMLASPDFLFLDEATSALDEKAEAELYDLLFKAIPETTIVSVAHRQTVGRFHLRHLDFHSFCSPLTEGGASHASD